MERNSQIYTLCLTFSNWQKTEHYSGGVNLLNDWQLLFFRLCVRILHLHSGSLMLWPRQPLKGKQNRWSFDIPRATAHPVECKIIVNTVRTSQWLSKHLVIVSSSGPLWEQHVELKRERRSRFWESSNEFSLCLWGWQLSGWYICELSFLAANIKNTKRSEMSHMWGLEGGLSHLKQQQQKNLIWQEENQDLGFGHFITPTLRKWFWTFTVETCVHFAALAATVSHTSTPKT